MPRQTRASLVRTFGADFADRVEALPTGPWHGPFESVQGVHLVRIVERHPPEPGVFENLETYLRQEWLMTRTRELQQERIAEIRAGYRIELAEQ
jgi:parvulin-like peptidyl-prolyl isomerase